jgi:hypothetical protein
MIAEQGGAVRMPATVLEGSSATGLTLASPLGALRLLSPLPLPPGTQLTLDVEQIQPAGELGVFPSSSAPAEAKGAAAPPWRALLDLPLPTVAALPGMGAPEGYMFHLLPRPGKELTAELVFLLSAVKGGEWRKWVGEPNLRRLEANSATAGEMARFLAAELPALHQEVGKDAEPGRWQLYQLPFVTPEGMTTPLRLLHRRSGEEKEGAAASRGEAIDHFVVDVTLARLGVLQLDGFIKKGAERKSFDLVVRSERPLEEEMKQGIREVFQQAQEIGGYNGGVSFRAGPDAVFRFPVPASESSAPPPPGEGEGRSFVV